MVGRDAIAPLRHVFLEYSWRIEPSVRLHVSARNLESIHAYIHASKLYYILEAFLSADTTWGKRFD